MAATMTTTTSASNVAKESVDTQKNSERLQLVTFEIGDEEFGVNILAVQEINRMMQITRVPQSPDCVEGVINLRGKIIPVLNLRKRFSFDAVDDSNENRIVVVEVSGRIIGFTVDRVNEVLRINSNIIEPPPSMVCGIDSEYLQGVGKLDDRLLIMLDVERLFSDQTLLEADSVIESASK